MWQGDPFINAYVQGWVAPRLLAQHGVTLQAVNGQGNMIVSALMTEKEAGKAESETDMMWINGETFYQLRQIDALYGPLHRAACPTPPSSTSRTRSSSSISSRR